MSTPVRDFRTVSDADRALIEAAGPVGDAILQAIGEGKHDVCVLAIAMSSILGSFVYGLTDPEMKREIVRHWCKGMIDAAGVALRVEVQQ